MLAELTQFLVSEDQYSVHGFECLGDKLLAKTDSTVSVVFTGNYFLFCFSKGRTPSSLYLRKGGTCDSNGERKLQIPAMTCDNDTLRCIGV